MYAFGLKHGFIPHGNRIPEYSSEESARKIEILESVPDTLEVLNEHEIATRYDMRVDQHPGSMYNSLTVVLGPDLKVVQTKEVPKIYSINFMIPLKPAKKPKQ